MTETQKRTRALIDLAYPPALHAVESLTAHFLA